MQDAQSLLLVAEEIVVLQQQETLRVILEEVALEFEEMCQEGQDRVDRGEVDF